MNQECLSTSIFADNLIYIMIIQPAERLQQVSEYYFSKKLKEIRTLVLSGKKIINLGIGSPDLAPDSSVVASLSQTAAEPTAHGYQSYVGLPELRVALTSFLKRTYDININPDNEILPLIGSKEGIMHVSMAFLNAGDTVLVPNPGYPTYSSVSNLLQANILSYPLVEEKGWMPDFDFLETPEAKAAKILWVNYPNMPTGADADVKAMKRLIDYCKNNQILLVNDNPYSLVLNTKVHPFSIFQIEGASEVALELNSLSKSHNMAGWRVGMIYGQSDYIDNVLKVKSNMDSGMFKGLQIAAIQALQMPLSWHADNNIIYDKRRKVAFQIFDVLGVEYSKDIVGMFVWGKIPTGFTSEAFADEILDQCEVFITPGFIFGDKGEGFIRISLCATEEVLLTALQRIQQFSI